MKAGDKVVPMQPTNQAAQWDIEDGIITLGKEYTVEQERCSNLLFIRNNEGKLTSVENFLYKKP